MTTQATARIVHDRGSVRFALSQHATHEIVENPKTVPVPGAPRHSLGLMPWQGSHIPLIDVAVLLGTAQPRKLQPRYALVVAMQPAPGAPVEHGAIALDALPETVTVEDTAACELPQSQTWRSVAVSCFESNGVPVPVLEAARLFVSA
jgi:chemotaxis signal transduction protein